MKDFELGIYFHDRSDKMFNISFSSQWKVDVGCVEKRYSSWMESFALFCYPKKYLYKEDINSSITQPIKIYEDEAVIDKIIRDLLNDVIVDLSEYFKESVELSGEWFDYKLLS